MTQPAPFRTARHRPMSRTALRLVAATLAVMYGVVGSTGVALHSLFDPTSGQAANAGPGEEFADAYFHDHGDGGHWHVHAPFRDQVEKTEKAPRDGRPGWNGPATRQHRDHACPLLALVRGVGSSLVSPAAQCVRVEPLGVAIFAAPPRVVSPVEESSLARGPPHTAPA